MKVFKLNGLAVVLKFLQENNIRVLILVLTKGMIILPEALHLWLCLNPLQLGISSTQEHKCYIDKIPAQNCPSEVNLKLL